MTFVIYKTYDRGKKIFYSVANELGLNKAEFVALIFGREQFNDVAYALGIYKTMRMAKIEKERK
ncbi:MAG TPA: hypothetical protein EYP22_02020 [Methanosarcinales archaeon]|nr:hypothetical protein [Methanosarcinales archaeon]